MTVAPGEGGWDAGRTLADDQRVERRILWKELAVLALLAALVAVRLVFAR